MQEEIKRQIHRNRRQIKRTGQEQARTRTRTRTGQDRTWWVKVCPEDVRVTSQPGLGCLGDGGNEQKDKQL